MAMLVMINSKKSTVWNGIHYDNSNFNNVDAVENLIHYVTRTRENEYRAGDLITCGATGAGYYQTVEDTIHIASQSSPSRISCYQRAEYMIQQFKYVQNTYRINSRKGRRMYHEVLNLLDIEAAWLNYDPFWFWKVGIECCQIYFQLGFQAVFAVHYEESKHYHFHFAVNSISYVDGRKWHTSFLEKNERESIFNGILNMNQVMAGRKALPIMYLNHV